METALYLHGFKGIKLNNEVKYKLSDIAKHTGSSWTFGGNGKKKQKKGTADAIGTTEGRQLEGAGTDYQKWKKKKKYKCINILSKNNDSKNESYL